MEQLKKLFDQNQKALMTLNEVIKYNISDAIIRDSVIKRFEYSWDAFWKYIKEYIAQVHGVYPDIPTPKSIFRLALKLEIITEPEFYELLKTVDDRNRTAHIYNENLAQEISARIPEYTHLFFNIFKRITIENI